MGCFSNKALEDKNKIRNKGKEEKEVKEEKEGEKENEEKEEKEGEKEKEVNKGKLKKKKKKKKKKKFKEKEENKEKEEIKNEKVNLQYSKEDPGFVPDQLIDILRESVIRIEIKNPKIISSGFFIKINLKMKEYKFLLTCHHSIPQEIIDSKTKVSIYYGRKFEEIKKKIILDRDQRFIKQYKDLDVTIIEIKDEDNIYENRFLHPDLNYKMGLEHYLNAQVYTAGYPNVEIHKGDKHYSAGFIKQIYSNGYVFAHTCDTKEGSSGGPIINYDKLVIGIHFGSIEEKKVNVGTFIGKIINELLLEEKKINPLIDEDDKEDEKEKNNSETKQMEKDFLFIEKMLENKNFVNLASEIAKNIDYEQFVSNLVNQVPVNNTPEEIEQFKDKENNIDYESLMKHNLGKMGYNVDQQNLTVKNIENLMNNPNYFQIMNNYNNMKNPDKKINIGNIIKKNEDNNNNTKLNEIFKAFENLDKQ